MTKKEFIEAIKDMPDDAPIMVMNFEWLTWHEAKPYYYKNENVWENTKGERMVNFIGLE